MRLLAVLLAVPLLGALASPAAAGTPFTIGVGKEPDVLVDPATGAATAAWIDTTQTPDRIATCHFPRGATSCTPQLLPSDAISGDADEPYLLRRPDGAVIVAMYRYVASDAYVWTSPDGGATFGPPLKIGGGSTGTYRGAPAFAGPASDRLAFVSFNGGGNVFGARLDGANAASTAKAALPGGGPYSPGVARTADGGLVAVANDIANIDVWRLEPGADPTTGPWSAVASPGAGVDTHVASGPSGTFLLSAVPGREEVRAWTGGTSFSAPVVAGAEQGYIGDLTVAPSGHVAAMWRLNGTPASLRLALSTGGPFALRTIAQEDLVFAGMDVSLAADDRGFAVYEGASAGDGSKNFIRAVSTDPVGATGAPVPVGATVTKPVGGATIAFGVPKACVPAGGRFRVTLTWKRKKRKGSLFVKVRRADFYIGRTLAKTDTKAPFRQTLTATATAPPGSAIRLRARATIKVRHGKAPKKSIYATVRVCS